MHGQRREWGLVMCAGDFSGSMTRAAVVVEVTERA
jgi:hypothetical protein